MKYLSSLVLLFLASSCSFFAMHPEIIKDTEELVEDVLEDSAGIKLEKKQEVAAK